MKKLALILAVMMLIPASAFGMQMLNNSTMDSITGQAGVTIALDDVQAFINIDKIAYIDCDGFKATDGYGTCSGSAGAVAISNFQIDVLNVNAITDSTQDTTTGNAGYQGSGTGLDLYSTSCGQIPLFYQYATSGAPSCSLGASGTNTYGLDNYTSIASVALGNTAGQFISRAITIDVTESLPSLTKGFQANHSTNSYSSMTIGGVLIGIPTVEIYIQEMLMTPVFDGDVTSNATNTAANDDGNGATYGTIELQGITFTPLSGWLEIAPH